MIPRIFGSIESDFSTNGVGALLNTISCEVKEEVNGTYELNAVILGNDPRISHVRVGNIITAKPNMTDPVQAFVIESVEKGINGEVNVYATHIAQHLAKLIPVSPFTASSLANTLTAIRTNSLENNPFTFLTDKTVATEFSFGVPKTVRSLMGGEEGSLLDVYRGEYYFNNLTIELLTRRGHDSGVRIMYGENMTDFTSGEGFGWSESVTGVIPYWKGEEEVVIGDIQYSEMAGYFEYHKTIVKDFSDKYEEAPTKAELNAYALSWITSKGNPTLTLDVSFDQYGLTNKQISNLGLGDTVHVVHNLYKLHYDSRIVSATFDVLGEKYLKLEIGSTSANLNEAVSSVAGDDVIVNDSISKLENNKVSKSGDTMSGQLLTSFKNSVAMGSYGTAQSTVEGLVGEVRYSSGCMGSVSISTAYTKDNVTVSTGWYNFIYSPHRTGGMNGSANGDNCNYGSLLLMGMTVEGIYRIRVASSNIAKLEKLVTTSDTGIIRGYQLLTGSSSGTVANNATGTITLTLTSVSGASDYILIPQRCNYGFVTAISRSGTTVTVTVMNSSGASHTMACSIIVLAI